MTDAADPIVTLEHLHGVRGFSTRPGFCNGVARVWFARHGLDWAVFRRQGLPASTFERTGCALGIALAAHARACTSASTVATPPPAALSAHAALVEEASHGR